MKYKALYRETRPEVFDEILGQDSIVKILKHQVATDTVSHAYIFTGTRGTGKTTTARILAKAVNCEAPDIEGRPCGKCDVCLKVHKEELEKKDFNDITTEINAIVATGVKELKDLIIKVSEKFNQEKVVKVVRWMIDNGELNLET